ADDIWLAEIGHYAARLQSLRELACIPMFESDVAATSWSFTRRADHHAQRRQAFIGEDRQVFRQVERFRPHTIHACLGEDRQRTVQRRRAEHRRGADLPGAGGSRRVKLVPHLELALLVAAPPASKTGQRAEVTLVDV